MRFWKRKKDKGQAVDERKESSKVKLEAATKWSEQLDKLKAQLNMENLERRFHATPVDFERRSQA